MTTTITMRAMRGAALVLAAVMSAAAPVEALGAQDLAARVAAVRDGRVQFTYTAREGVCGDGRSFVRIGRSTYVGTWNDGMDRHRCDPGPVRVVARLQSGTVDEIRHYVGGVPRSTAEGVTDLGAVPAPAAARWLMDVARGAPGRAASKAIFPAVLADSAVVWRDLLAIARDESGRSRDTRREAANWLSHFASAAVSGAQPGALDFETGVGADGQGESGETEVKKSAVFALSQLRDNSGVPQLVTVARTNKDPEVRRSALFWLGQSGDPRGLALFEEVLSKGR